MARSFVENKLHYLRYYYRGTGLVGILRKSLRTLLRPLYYREAYYILTRRLDEQETRDCTSTEWWDLETDCSIIESVEALHAIQHEIPASFRHSVTDFAVSLERGCVLVIVRRPKADEGGKLVVGYDISERGVCSIQGYERAISPEIAWGRYSEILPEYRGRRLHEMLVSVRFEYWRRNGVKKSGGTIEVHNRPSLLAGLRTGSTIVGTSAQVSVCGGLYTWRTPWEHIEASLRR